MTDWEMEGGAYGLSTPTSMEAATSNLVVVNRFNGRSGELGYAEKAD